MQKIFRSGFQICALFSQLVFQCVILPFFIKEIENCKNQLMELCGTAEQDQCQCDHHGNSIPRQKQPGITSKMSAHIIPAKEKENRRINRYADLMECILEHVHSKSFRIINTVFIQINDRCNTGAASKCRNTIKGTEKHIFYSPLITKIRVILFCQHCSDQCFNKTIYP